VLGWLEKCNCEEEEKEKYFFSKFTKKPMDWLHKNSKEEYEKVMQMRRKENLHQNEKISQT
jgi:hypothetical protein